MAIETEIKLRIEDTFTVEKLISDERVQSYLKEDFRDIQMESTYYDTADGEAVRRRWALRLRREDDKTVATLKTRNELSVEGGKNIFIRNEWQTEAPTFEAAIPQLIELGAPEELRTVVENSSLQAQCQVRFVRKSAILYLPDGVRVDMCVDRGELIAGEKSEPIWELELELLFGAPSAVEELAAYLEEKYGLKKEYVSKYERALRLLRSRR